MKWKRILLAGAVFTALASGLAIAQSIAVSNLAGTELIRGQLGAGGTGIFIPDYVLRSGQNYQLVATGTTIATQAAITSGALIATGAITTWNITLPANAYDGQTLVVTCPGGDTTTLSIAASTTPSGQTIVGTNPTSCTAATPTSSTWQYAFTTKVWYRIK